MLHISEQHNNKLTGNDSQQIKTKPFGLSGAAISNTISAVVNKK